jgi:hypothetical protein
MTAVVHGPYEHVGAYADLAESEVFDTSGTPIDFCAVCEHAPCVAGGNTWCGMPPRSSTVWRIEKEIEQAVDFTSPHALLLLSLLDTVAVVAASSTDSYDRDYARRRLEKELVKIRAAGPEVQS